MKLLHCLVPTLAAVTALLSTPASAHVRLVYPTPRYPAPSGFPDNGDELKFAPCGVTGDSRTTDPNRITMLEAGQTITVQFRETIDHSGHYRIAFDDDGQDAFQDPDGYDDIRDPGLPIILDGIADEDGGDYQVDITLPNVPCTNCTLQLIQLMTDKPPYELGDDDVYHQCADIVLTGPGAGGAGGGGGVAGTANTGGMPASGGATGTGGVTSGAGGVTAGAPGTGGSAGSSGSASAGRPPITVNEADGGCAINGRPSDAHGPLALLALLLSGLSWRRARSLRSSWPR